MSRALPGPMAVAIVQPLVKVILLAELNFASGPIRCWTGRGPLNWNGVAWLGTGEFGGISPVDETTEIGAAGLTFTLSGIPSDLIATCLADPYRGRSAKLWLAIVDNVDNPTVLYAYQVFGGRMDTIKLADTGQTSTVTLQAENRLIDLGRPRNLRYTDQEQQRIFPGDIGLQYVAKLPGQPIWWGVAPSAPAASPGYGGQATLGGAPQILR